MKYFFFILLMASFSGKAQTVSPQVMNAAGEHRQAPSISISDNIGEVFTETQAGPAIVITQGFLQPEISDGVSIAYSGLSCVDRDDGMISISFSSLNQQHSEQYLWSAGACPSGNCDNRVDNLKAGDYYVTIISTYTTIAGKVGSDTIRRGPIQILNSTEACRLVVYSGVTPNRDGQNDTWFIENITEFPANRVSIYNRWGVLLYDEQGYDNVTKFWPKEEMLNKLVSSTYFYIIELGDGSKPLKGWVELIKN